MPRNRNVSKLVIFDYHGTLIWALDIHNRAMARTARKLWGIDASIYDADFTASTVPKVIAEMALAHGVPLERVEAKQDMVLEMYDDNFIQELESMDFRVLPGAKELLQALKHEDVCLFLYTGDSERSVEAILGKAGLLDSFPAKLCASNEMPMVGTRGELLEAAVRKAKKFFGIDFGSNNIFLMDDSGSAISAGNRLGINTMGVETGPEEGKWPEEPEHRFDNLAEFEKVLKIILA